MTVRLFRQFAFCILHFAIPNSPRALDRLTHRGAPALSLPRSTRGGRKLHRGYHACLPRAIVLSR
jgi:hypothetical protein